MKKALLILGVLLLFVAVQAAEPEPASWSCHWDQNLSVNLEDDLLVFSSDDNPAETVKMDAEGHLWINGEEIALNRSERKMVAEYYEMMSLLVLEATEVGLEGAKVGLHGAKLALSALGEILEAAVTEKEMKEAEAAIEKRSREVEKRAEKIEKRAGKLEAMAEKLEKKHEKLKNEVKELERLSWF